MSLRAYPITIAWVLAGGQFVCESVCSLTCRPKRSAKASREVRQVLAFAHLSTKICTTRAGNGVNVHQEKASSFTIGACPSLTFTRLLVPEGSLFGQSDASNSFPEVAPSPRSQPNYILCPHTNLNHLPLRGHFTPQSCLHVSSRGGQNPPLSLASLANLNNHRRRPCV